MGYRKEDDDSGFHLHWGGWGGGAPPFRNVVPFWKLSCQFSINAEDSIIFIFPSTRIASAQHGQFIDCMKMCQFRESKIQKFPGGACP